MAGWACQPWPASGLLGCLCRPRLTKAGLCLHASIAEFDWET